MMEELVKFTDARCHRPAQQNGRDGCVELETGVTLSVIQ
jgi:hypothetical protein